MKKIFILILFQFCAGLLMAQQEKWKFNPEEFRAKLEEFITKKAEFTSAEAQTFFPIFHQMKEEQRTLQKEIFSLKRIPKDATPSEKEYTNKIQRICELNIKIAQMMLRQFDQRKRNNNHPKK